MLPPTSNILPHIYSFQKSIRNHTQFVLLTKINGGLTMFSGLKFKIWFSNFLKVLQYKHNNVAAYDLLVKRK